VLATHGAAVGAVLRVNGWAARCRASMISVTYETGRMTDVDPAGVSTRDAFGDFLLGVLADFRSGASEWQNGTLERFLDGLSAFALARLVNTPDAEQERASWQLFAEMIAAATGYE
jgi:hypothetical protein